MSSPDVIVIGGGPAGSASAIRLAQKGRRVRLYEKTIFPRQKLCGGYLSHEGVHELDRLGVLEDVQKNSIPLYRTVIASTKGTRVESPLHAPALSITRDSLDSILLRLARKSGVDVHEGEDGRPHIGSARYTVIAAGRGFHPAFPETRKPHFIGIQATFENVSGITDQVELDIVEGGYVGLARQEAARVNVCALTTIAMLKTWGPSLDSVMARFLVENPVLRDHMKDATRVGEWMAVNPVRMGIRTLAKGNVFYAGDAACVVDPFAGEGMSIGLYTANLLTEALTQTLEKPDVVYHRLWRKAFLPPLRWSAALRVVNKFSWIQEASLHVLQHFPSALRFLSEATRHRPIEGLEWL